MKTQHEETIEQMKKEEDKYLKKLGQKRPNEISLKTILQRHTKDELNNIAKFFQIKGAGKKKKDDFIDDLSDELPKRFLDHIMNSEDQLMEFYMHLTENDGCMNVREEKIFQGLTDKDGLYSHSYWDFGLYAQCYVYLDVQKDGPKQMNAYMPKELLELCKRIDWAKAMEKAKKNTRRAKAVEALLYSYGMATEEVLLDVLQKNLMLEEEATIETQMLYARFAGYEIVELWPKVYGNWDLAQKPAFNINIWDIEEVSYKDYPLAMMTKFAMQSAFSNIPEVKGFKDYLIRNYEMTETQASELMAVEQVYLASEMDVEKCFEAFTKYFRLKSERERLNLRREFLKMAIHVPTYYLKGYSIVEADYLFKTTYNTFVEEREGQVYSVKEKKKIGRNDLCPCGSGLKYKHCCGK